MIIKASWEFDVDVEGLDPEWIDIPELAKELTRRELRDLLIRCDLTEEDFEYSVEEDESRCSNSTTESKTCGTATS